MLILSLVSMLLAQNPQAPVVIVEEDLPVTYIQFNHEQTNTVEYKVSWRDIADNVQYTTDLGMLHPDASGLFELRLIDVTDVYAGHQYVVVVGAVNAEGSIAVERLDVRIALDPPQPPTNLRVVIKK